MDIAEACKVCETKIRKHIDKIFPWTERIPTVVDLDKKEKAILDSQGTAALNKYLYSQNHFPFPALDITSPRKICVQMQIAKNNISNIAIVYPKCSQFLYSFAQKLSSLLSKNTGTKINILTDDQLDLNNAPVDNLLILGGAHENSILRLLAYHNLNYSDLEIPGKNGFMINTILGFPEVRKNIVTISLDRENRDEVLMIIENAVSSSIQGRYSLANINKIKLSKEFAAKLGSAENILRAISQMPHLQSRNITPDIETFGSQLNKLWDSGGPEKCLDNGHATIPTLSYIFHAYKISGDIRFLKIYKEIMLGLVDYYLNTPGGASIPSDYDFYFRGLIPTWWLAEAEPVFSEAERLVITNFLLASIRQIRMYKKTFAPSPDNKLRHNHETFPALSLYYAAKYFENFNIPDTADWFKEAEKVFSGPIGKVFKHIENSNSYQWIAPAHKLIYDVVSGKMETVKNKNILKTAQGAVISVDNFGYATDYGDAGCPIRNGASMIPFLYMVADELNEGSLAWTANFMQKALHYSPTNILPHPGWGRCAQNCQVAKHEPACGDLELYYLDKHFVKEYDPDMIGLDILDKIGYRGGWGKDSQFLFFAPSAAGIHTHHDMNGILRYNHRGRIWIVDNGYGKTSGLKNCADSWSTRQVGPEDHNVVIFRGNDGTPVIPPPFGTSTIIDDNEKFAVFQNNISGIKGSEWLRTVIIYKDRYLLVIDQIHSAEKHAVVECQFNLLGELTENDNSWILSQDGVNMFVQSLGAGEKSNSSYRNASWDAALTPKIYPYAKNPVKKLLRTVKNPAKDTYLSFVTLFEASNNEQAQYIAEYSSNCIQVHGPHPKHYVVANKNLDMNSSSTLLTIEFKYNQRQSLEKT